MSDHPVPASRAPWDRLRHRMAGDLVLPGEPAYVESRQLELAQFDHVEPRAVLYCRDARDVSHALRFARGEGLPVAVRSGGHSYGGYSTGPGLLVDLSRIAHVTVGDRTASIGPGALNVDVLTSLAAHDLVVSEGGCATVAAGGFVLGGGFGLLTRSLGMACDSLTSAEVVLADGEVVTASAREHDDLYWALRGGGGGNFGVVTSFEVVPSPALPMPTTILGFPHDRVATVLDAFARWMVDTPRTIGGGAYVVAADPRPDAVPTTSIMLTSRGSTDELATEVERLLLAGAGAPAFRQDAVLSYPEIETMVFGAGTPLTLEQCHREGRHPLGRVRRQQFGVERTRFAGRDLTLADWERVIAAFDAGTAPGLARYLDVHMFGGAVNDIARRDTAYVHRDAQFSINYRLLIPEAADDTAEHRAIAQGWVDRGFEVIDPLSNGETYQNWMDPALEDWANSFYAENLPRLARTKAAYDPSEFFHFEQGIRAAGS